MEGKIAQPNSQAPEVNEPVRVGYIFISLDLKGYVIMQIFIWYESSIEILYLNILESKF